MMTPVAGGEAIPKVSGIGVTKAASVLMPASSTRLATPT
jgi:hypothetical protein